MSGGTRQVDDNHMRKKSFFPLLSYNFLFLSPILAIKTNEYRNNTILAKLSKRN